MLLSFQHFLFPLLLAISVVGLVNGLYKLLDDGPLVPNPIPGMVYLFQFPRTSTCPSQAPLNLKVKTWLMWHRIPFHRLSNHFFLGSHTRGTTPFVELDGQHIDGSDEIINTIAEINKIDIKKDDEVQQGLRTLIDDQLFKILMFDRAYNTGKGKGLDFMLSDEGIIHQIIPLLIPNKKLTVPGVRDGRFKIALDSDTWEAFFDVSSRVQQLEKDGEEVDQQTKSMARQFLTKVKDTQKKGEKLEWNDWETFDKWLREGVITPTLASVFKASSKRPGNSEDKLKKYLDQNDLVEGRPYSSFSEKEMLDVLQEKVSEVVEGLKIAAFRPESSLFTPAHASLFGFAVQFFETPLNYPLFNKYSESKKIMNVKILREYVVKVKKHLGLDKVWEKMKSRPWPLNWDGEQHYSPEDEKKVSQNVLAAIGKVKAILDAAMKKGATHEEIEAAKKAVGQDLVNEY